MTSSNIRFVMEEYDVEHLDRHLLWMYPFIIGREFYCPELRVTWVEISGERPALNYLFWDKRVGGLVGQSFVLPRPGLRKARLVDAEIAASEFVEPMGYLGRDAYGVLWEDGCGPIPPSRCVANPSNFAACVFAEESESSSPSLVEPNFFTGAVENAESLIRRHFPSAHRVLLFLNDGVASQVGSPLD